MTPIKILIIISKSTNHPTNKKPDVKIKKEMYAKTIDIEMKMLKNNGLLDERVN